MSIVVKDPDAILDYQFDWSAWLGDDSITDFDLMLDDDGLAVGDGGEAPEPIAIDGRVVFWLLEGVPRQTYPITCRITTAAGRVDDRTMFIKVRER